MLANAYFGGTLRRTISILTILLAVATLSIAVGIVVTLRVTSVQSNDLRQDIEKAGFTPANDATAGDGMMQIIVIVAGCRVILGRSMLYDPFANTTEAIEPYWFRGVQEHEEVTPARNVTGLAPLTKESPTTVDVLTHLTLPAHKSQLAFCLAA